MHDKTDSLKQQRFLVRGVAFHDNGGGWPPKHVGLWTDCTSMCMGLDQFIDNNLVDWHGAYYTMKYRIHVVHHHHLHVREGLGAFPVP